MLSEFCLPCDSYRSFYQLKTTLHRGLFRDSNFSKKKMSLGQENLKAEDVIQFLKVNGGKITNHELVRNFRSKLTDPVLGNQNKLLLKEITGKVSFVKKLEGRKIIQLKPQFENMATQEIVDFITKSAHPPSDISHSTPTTPAETNDPSPPPLPSRSSTTRPPPKLPPKYVSTKKPKLSSGAKIVSRKPPAMPKKIAKITAQPEKKIEEKLVSDDESDFVKKENVFKERQKNQTMSVKDQTKFFDEIASTSDLKLKDHAVHIRRNPKAGQSPKDFKQRRQSIMRKGGDAENEPAFLTWGKETKGWILAVSKNDLPTVTLMIRKNNPCVLSKDPWNGYTGLHWASKHGNLKMVKLFLEARLIKIDPRGRPIVTPVVITIFTHDVCTTMSVLLKFSQNKTNFQ